MEEIEQENETIIDKAWKLFREEKWKEAEQACIKSLKHKRFNSNAWALMGLLEQKKGKHNHAVLAFRAALAYGPDLHAVHYSLGVSLRLTGKAKAALAHLKIANKAEPDIANYSRELAITQFELGDYDQSELNFKTAMSSSQTKHLVFLYLGHIAKKRGNYNVAIDYYNEASQTKPNFNVATIAKAETLLEIDEFDRALEIYLNLLKNTPDDVHFNLKIASLLFTLGRLGPAEQHAKKSIKNEPGNIEAHILLGKIILSKGNLSQAQDIFEKTLNMQPDDSRALVAHAVLLERKGEIERARKIVDTVINDIPDHPQLLMLLARLQDENAGRRNVVNLISKRLSSDKPLNRDARAQLNFSNGTLLDRLGDIDSAFLHFSEGNKLRSHARTFDKDVLIEEFNTLKKIFTKDFFLHKPISEYQNDSNMIFIVGMPRSGTSLTEQIFSSHSQIYGVGEQILLGKIIDQWFEVKKTSKQEHYLGISDELNSDILTTKAEEYYSGLPKISAKYMYIVDKMPYNFMHLGLLSLIFPKAKIVHCTRNAVDTTLSCFFQDFAEGNSFSYNLENCGWFYQQYKSLMDHWIEVLPIPVYTSSYELLVDNPKEEIIKLLKYCDLEFENTCMNFHQTGRIVHTASYQQVREPIYKRSIEKWRRYEKHIGPLFRALDYKF